MKTNVRAISLSECVDMLLAVDSVAVATHIRPDGDTVGGSVALCKILTALGKDVRLLLADDLPDRLAFLTEGVALAEGVEGRHVITCDVASPAQLGELYDRVGEVYMSVDHHRVSTPFAPHYTLPDLSSAGEVVLGIASELCRRGLLTLTKDIAYPLYAAISSDTGGFVFSSATAPTYRAAATLIETGIDFSDINHRLFHSKSREQIRAEGLVASRLVSDGNIAYAIISRRDREGLSLKSEHFDTAIDVVRSLIGVEISFTVKELDDGGYRVSLRSNGFDVARVAASFGGGGHVRASGCTVIAETPEEAAALVLGAIKSRL